MYMQSRFTDIENKGVSICGYQRGEGQIRGMGLTETNYYI